MAYISRQIFVKPDCKWCPLQGIPKVAPEGETTAQVALVGEGPGENETKRNRPFIGRSGALLNELLKRSRGPSRAQLWITNAALCEPQYVDIDPSTDYFVSKKQALEMSTLNHCRSRLLEELWRVHPRVIVAVGNYALRSLTSRDGVTKYHGSVIPIDLDWLHRAASLGVEGIDAPWSEQYGIPNLARANATYVIPMLHPASLLRGDTRQAQVCIEVLRKAWRIAREGPRPEDQSIQLLVSPHHPLGGDHAIDELERWADILLTDGSPLGVDVETTEEDARKATLTVVGFGSAKFNIGISVSVLTWVRDKMRYVMRWTKRQWDRLYTILQKLLGSRIEKWFWNMNFDVTVLERYFPAFRGPFQDGIHWHWLLQPDTHHNLGFACQTYLDIGAWKVGFWQKQKAGIATDRDLLIYNADDAKNTMQVIPHLQHGVLVRRNEHLVKHQLRVTELARKAYLTGIPVDLARVAAARQEYLTKRDEALTKIKLAIKPQIQKLNEYVHEQRCNVAQRSALNRGVVYKEPKRIVVEVDDWNHASPYHGRWFLYEFLNLPVSRLTKGGDEGTNKQPSHSYRAVLDYMNRDLVQEYIDAGEYDYRLTRLNEFEAKVDKEDCRLHPPWNTTGQANTRWRSSPNCQNFSKYEKKILVAPPGYVWVGADAAQLEMRILACLAGIAKLLALFNQTPFDERAEPWKKLDPRYDSHSLVSTLVYGDRYLKLDDAAKGPMRTLVKRIVYGMNYGAWPPKIQGALLEDKRLDTELRKQLAGAGGLRRVTEVFNGFHAYLPEVNMWAEAQVAHVRTVGCQIIPPFERRRYWPISEIEETKIRNTPIQASAGDVVNYLFCKMDDAIVAAGLGAQDAAMVLHGHDACYWLVREQHAKLVQRIVNDNFEYWLTGPAGPVHIYGQATIGPTAADVA